MRFRMGVGLAVLMVGTAFAAEFKSGPQVGDSVGPFHPLNVTGKSAGKKNCLVCQNGTNPVAMVFAREANTGLTSLVKKLDAETVKHADAKMGSFVVFCNDDEKLEEQLKKWAEKEGIKNTILSIDNPAGPEKMKVNKDADVTVVLYQKNKVKFNYAFKKGELTKKAIDQVVADVAKIIPAKTSGDDDK